MSNPLGNNGASKDPEIREKQFWVKAELVDDCWLWTGFIMWKGYGSLKYFGKPKRAHRLAYELVYGEVPKGLVLDHLCRNRSCVNPEHLEAVTNQVNIVRGHQARKAELLG